MKIYQLKKRVWFYKIPFEEDEKTSQRLGENIYTYFFDERLESQIGKELLKINGKKTTQVKIGEKIRHRRDTSPKIFREKNINDTQ